MAFALTPSSTLLGKSHALDNDFVARYADLIRQCRDSGALAQGKLLHARLARSLLDTHTFLGNLLVEMYGRCGSTADAAAAFDRIANRNVFSWTILIAAFARNGQSVPAMVAFQQMDLEGVRPNKVTFLAMVDACSGYGCPAQALDLHQRVLASIEFDLVLATAIISMLGKCGIIAAAEEEFLANLEEIESKRCVIAWNAMLAAYARNGCHRECLDLFQEIVELDQGLPDAATIASALSACCDPKFLDPGKAIHARAIADDRMDRSTVVGNCIVRMYAQCQSFDDSMAAFEEITAKNAVSWSIAMAALVQAGRSDEAARLLWRMDLDGTKPDKIAMVSTIGTFGESIPPISNPRPQELAARARAAGLHTDPFVGSAIVSMLARSGILDDACESFAEVSDKRDIVVWNSLLAALESQEAIELFHRLCLEGIAPNPATLVSVFDALSTLGCDDRDRALAMAIKLESLIASSMDLSSNPSMLLVLENSMINAFGKLGSLADARRIFDGMRNRSVVSWTAMIDAYARQGFHREALVLFEQMDFDQEIQPNDFTLSTILASCARVGEIAKIHARAQSIHGDLDLGAVVGSALIASYGDCGCVEESLRVFQEIKCKNTVTWNAMIEALAKNNQAGDAIHLLHTMDLEGVKASAATLAIAISACSQLGRIDQAREIHARAAAINLGDGDQREILGVAMINLYGRGGLLPDARRSFQDLAKSNTRASISSWNAIVAAIARAGDSRGVVEAFHSIHLEGLEPNQATFWQLLASCCHTGLLDEVWERFIYMREDHGVEQAKRHWSSVVDALARAGSMGDAADVARTMPFRPSTAVWKILLHACQIHGEGWGSAHGAAREASRLRPMDAVPYVLLANMYATS
ncbi:putative pentatricopeptide repeat-containing protein At3g01580 [Selaginella moellendorffii]|uniref:putative pentatricopeptide repeat-containing protein At3g01580 n=1 Tax=Selaginella moellendorffii TaxID=88036 RepID=UPI000D1CE777|nr:putative pentatricopeptide repeat-containing protein At3g01580 [Selaginella moellendorffii]|eukprot:XP_024544305.1 putative pentatricopeptide repeat-containing protein At3g01580 [Selaginella moellendorffii]